MLHEWDSKRFRSKFIERRKELGMTQGQLAAKAGVSQARVCDIERIDCAPRISTLLYVADALSSSPMEVISWGCEAAAQNAKNLREWSDDEIEALCAYRFLGASGIADRIREECVSEVSSYDVSLAAEELGISIEKKDVCNGCGAVGVRLNRISKLCRVCDSERRVAEERAFNELLKAEAEAIESSRKPDENEREAKRLRQENFRIINKHGLEGKRKRKSKEKEMGS